jgi:hypothetical protein
MKKLGMVMGRGGAGSRISYLRSIPSLGWRKSVQSKSKTTQGRAFHHPKWGVINIDESKRDRGEGGETSIEKREKHNLHKEAYKSSSYNIIQNHNTLNDLGQSEMDRDALIAIKENQKKGEKNGEQ